MKLRSISHLWLVLGVMLSACAAPSVSVRVMQPAEVPEATKYRAFAVLPFQGRHYSYWGSNYNDAVDFTEGLEAALTSHVVDDKPYFTTITRDKLSRVTKELKLGQSGLVEASQAPQVGKLLGAQVLYMGSVSQVTFTDAPYYKEEPGDCIDKKCERRYSNKRIHCDKRTVLFPANPKAVETRTGRNVFGRQVSGRAESEACGGSGKPLLGWPELREQALKDAIRQVVWAVAPHEVELKLELLEMDDGIVKPEDKEALSRGLDFIKRGRAERACEEWTPAAAKEPKSAALVFNAGICREIANDLSGALVSYKKADRLVGDLGGSSVASLADKMPGQVGDMLAKASNPDKITQNAIKRVEEQMKKRATLRNQRS